MKNKTVQFKMYINGEHVATFECSSRQSKRVRRKQALLDGPNCGQVTFSRNKPV